MASVSRTATAGLKMYRCSEWGAMTRSLDSSTIPAAAREIESSFGIRIVSGGAALSQKSGFAIVETTRGLEINLDHLRDILMAFIETADVPLTAEQGVTLQLADLVAITRNREEHLGYKARALKGKVADLVHLARVRQAAESLPPGVKVTFGSWGRGFDLKESPFADLWRELPGRLDLFNQTDGKGLGVTVGLQDLAGILEDWAAFAQPGEAKLSAVLRSWIETQLG